MPENLRKASLYFRSTHAYWPSTDTREALVVDPGILGRYQINYEPRLTSGHYRYFDHQGLPLRVKADAKVLVYNYSTMCGLALGYWDRYLRFGCRSDLARVTAVADYMLRTVDKSGGVPLLRNDTGKGRHTANPSALAQGQAISVLCRAWHATKYCDYLKTACQLLPAFDVPIERGGILGRISTLAIPWFEEYVDKPLNHVLNGKLIALLGLRDLALTAGIQRAMDLFYGGVFSVTVALPHFDTGFWSWYQIPESGRPYIASMGYHMLHVRLLRGIGQAAGAEELTRHADRFESYARDPLNRCSAVLQMVRSKSHQIASKLITQNRRATATIQPGACTDESV